MNNDDKKAKAAARVAAYRKRIKDQQTVGDGGEKQFNAVLPLKTLRALERLARHNIVTQKEMLIRLIQDADNRILDTLADDAIDAYYSAQVTPRLRKNDNG